MSNGNDGVRIVIDRKGGHWYWGLTAHGQGLTCGRPETSPSKAAETAENSLLLVEAHRHYKNQRTA